MNIILIDDGCVNLMTNFFYDHEQNNLRTTNVNTNAVSHLCQHLAQEVAFSMSLVMILDQHLRNHKPKSTWVALLAAPLPGSEHCRHHSSLAMAFSCKKFVVLYHQVLEHNPFKSPLALRVVLRPFKQANSISHMLHQKSLW